MKIEVYKDKKKQWRWRMFASNGKNVANCGQGYTRRGYCLQAIENLFEWEFDYKIVEV